MSKISVSLPDHLISDLDRVATSVGFTRSAIITYYLMGPVNQLLADLGGLPLEVEGGGNRRARGSSLNDLHKIMSDLGVSCYVPLEHFNFELNR